MLKIKLMFAILLTASMTVMAGTQTEPMNADATGIYGPKLMDSILVMANSGDAPAQALLGRALAQNGNDADAINWLNSAITSGYTRACKDAAPLMSKYNWKQLGLSWASTVCADVDYQN